jgi:hypothetical protein
MLAVNIINAIGSFFDPKTTPQVDNSYGLLPLAARIDDLCKEQNYYSHENTSSELVTRAERAIVDQVLSSNLQTQTISTVIETTRKNETKCDKENRSDDAKKLKEEACFFEGLKTFLLKNSALLAQAKELRQKNPEKYLDILENRLNPKIALFIDTLLGLGYDIDSAPPNSTPSFISGERCFPGLINQWRMKVEKEVKGEGRDMSVLFTGTLEKMARQMRQSFNVPALCQVIAEMPRKDSRVGSAFELSLYEDTLMDCLLFQERAWKKEELSAKKEAETLPHNAENRDPQESQVDKFSLRFFSLLTSNELELSKDAALLNTSPDLYVQYLSQLSPDLNTARAIDHIASFESEKGVIPATVTQWRQKTDRHIANAHKLAAGIGKIKSPGDQNFSLLLNMAKRMTDEAIYQKNKSLSEIIHTVITTDNFLLSAKDLKNEEKVNSLITQSECLANIGDFINENTELFKELGSLAQNNPKEYLQFLNLLDKPVARIVDQLVIASFLKTSTTASPELAEWRRGGVQPTTPMNGKNKQRPLKAVTIFEG